MNKIVPFLQTFFDLFLFKKANKYSTENVKEYPENFDNKTIYLLGMPSKPLLAGIICPCGCNEVIELILHPAKSPSWKIENTKKNNVTIYPSIKKVNGCKSHFFIINGKIRWC